MLDGQGCSVVGTLTLHPENPLPRRTWADYWECCRCWGQRACSCQLSSVLALAAESAYLRLCPPRAPFRPIADASDGAHLLQISLAGWPRPSQNSLTVPFLPLPRPTASCSLPQMVILTKHPACQILCQHQLPENLTCDPRLLTQR